ncbi:SH3 and multiple ankyrin repeat domains protein 3 [Ostrinia furnacalis]|uniref:SH3 and multiple ankyrin repeat domains protein 3 n=1 Tax=Ostrinia furnacalis TaxID=93504 RepID=UPI00103C9F74|nr:SH3 and multiple ankyrin repeat domains protein 3 [Ostrinia furnacalis]
MEGECSEGAEGWLLVRVHVPELNVQKSLQFPRDQLVWDVKQQCLAALPKVASWYRELKESFNYGLFCPPVNGKAGKFLDEERRLGDYPFNGPVGYLELKYKRRVYKMLKLDEKTLKALHSRANLRRFLEHVTHAQVDKITKACAKGLDPNFHCQETGDTPLTIAAGLKSPGKVLIALVNGGALLDYRTKDGSTAMHRAVEKNSLEAVKTLLELGASPNYKDGKALTPLYLSVTNKTDPLLCETLLHDHATIGATDLQGWQEVHQACRNGLVQHLDHLLFYGADMNGRNASGNTPLHVCAVNAQDSCARQLLFRGCDKEALNFANQTPYQVAVIAGNLELAEVIKNYKTDEVVPFRGPPRYNPKRRSGAWGWWAGDRSSLASSTRIPELDAMLRAAASPCSLERPFSSASSSISDASHPSHEDDASIVTDKSAGDTSDIISDSSGVGTSNSDTTTCSLQAAATTVVCLQPYEPSQPGHIRLNQGDIIEVSSATDDGYLEGTVRGSGAAGLFPAHCVQEVRLRQNTHLHQVLSSGPIHHSRVTGRREMALSKTYSATAPRIKKSYGNMETRTVVLHRAKRGFGFILRGAKASSPLMELRPSERCPGLQYLDDVDAGGVADRAGLRKGDFLIAINGEDVSAASHEHVVELIRSSGALVSMTVVSLAAGTEGGACAAGGAQAQLSSSGRPYAATLPRKAAGGRSPAPAPPRRDPRTTLSVGRARAKSMVAGLENGGEKEESCEPLSVAGKSSSAESVQLHGGSSNSGTPMSGTPVAPRTASIRQRPASGRITAAELEELFQRQADAAPDLGGNNAMMTRSAFQGGSNSPPYSPARGNGSGRVYASVAEMKRSRGKAWGKANSTAGAVASAGGTLRRDFHSTPDLAAAHAHHPPRTRSSEDVHGRSHAWASGRTADAQRARAARLPLHARPGRGARAPPAAHALQRGRARGRGRRDFHSTPDLAAAHAHHPPRTRSSEDVHADAQRTHSGRGRRDFHSTPDLAAAHAHHPPRTRSSEDVHADAQRTHSGRGRRDFHSTPDLAAAHAHHPPRTRSSEDVHVLAAAHAHHPPRTRSSEDVHGPARVPPPAHPPPPPPGARASTFRPADAAKLYAAPPHRPPPALAYRAPGRSDSEVRLGALRSWAGPARAASADEPAHYAQPFNAHAPLLRQNSTPAPPIPEPDYSMSESDEEEPKPKSEPPPPAETSANSNASGSSSGSSSMQHSFSVDEIQKIRTRLKSSRSCGDELGAERDDADNSSSGVSSDQEAHARPAGAAPRRDKVSFCASVTVKSCNDVISTEPVHSSSESLAPPPPPMQRHNSLTRKRAAAALVRGAGAGRGRSAAERLGVDVDKAPGRGRRGAGLLAALPPPPEEPGPPEPQPAPLLAPPPQFSDRVRVVAALPKQLARLQ